MIIVLVKNPAQIVRTLKAEVEANIRLHEGAFYKSVLADFREGLDQQRRYHQRVNWCHRWLRIYNEC